MKTGRRRKKETIPELPEQPSIQPSPPEPPLVRPAPRAFRLWLPILVIVIVLICGGLLLSRACLGPQATPTTYLPATAAGSWTTTVRLLVPEVTVQEGWRSDCEADPQCIVLPGTCQVQEREDRYTERTVDDYDEYAYSIYYEETEDRLYEAAGQDFVSTQLNARKEWWEGERNYTSEEWLDEGTCQYTQYTVWITDPEDSSSEIEVVLSKCEVWDHVVVTERVYEEDEYCRTENQGAMAVQDTLTRQGVGAGVEWPGAAAPAGGKLERAFGGTVVFRADGTTYTVQVTDADAYIRYLTVPHYLEVDEQGHVVDLTDQAP